MSDSLPWLTDLQHAAPSLRPGMRVLLPDGSTERLADTWNLPHGVVPDLRDHVSFLLVLDELAARCGLSGEQGLIWAHMVQEDHHEWVLCQGLDDEGNFVFGNFGEWGDGVLDPLCGLARALRMLSDDPEEDDSGVN